MKDIDKLYTACTFKQYITEDIDLKKSGMNTVEVPEGELGSTIKKEDLTNLIFANTNGGTENFTVWSIRKNDSKSDPSKKAGTEMVTNGKLKIPATAINGKGSPLGSPMERYGKYNILTMYVSSIDGENYIKKFPEPNKRIRNVKVDTISKIKMGGETYHVV